MNFSSYKMIKKHKGEMLNYEFLYTIYDDKKNLRYKIKGI